MSRSKDQRRATEADLESRIDGALRRVFPWLEPGALTHQSRFTLQVGRSGVTVDGESVSRVEARADIIISHEGRPLAVLELKRPGETLTRADELQGLSYAALLHPHPPLVVVTNGTDFRLLETHTGEEWIPVGAPERALAGLFASASRAAAVDLGEAVEVLLGSRTDVWVGAVRAATRAVLDDLSGDWQDSLRPFARDFLIPRTATSAVLRAFSGSPRLVVVEGPPLAGKSSALRDVAERTSAGDEFATLLVEAGRGATGIFRSLADLLSDALGWPASEDEARRWLRLLSNRTGGERGPTLLLAVDGLGPGHDGIESEIAEITSGAYGSGVRLILAVDDTFADRLMRSGRQASRVGRRAVRVKLGELSEHEFAAAAELLWQQRMEIIEGGIYSDELRSPWVLRALAAKAVSEPEYGMKNLAAVLPPVPGLDLIVLARERLSADPVLRMRLREVARAVLEDSEDPRRPVGLLLESVFTFVVRRATLLRHVGSADVDDLAESGVLKLTFGSGDEPLYVVRLPELVASTTAALLGEGLHQRLEDEVEAADWLVSRSGGVPLGDVIAAQAILDCAAHTGSLPLKLVHHLASRPPRADVLDPAGRFAIQTAEFEAAELAMDHEGALVDAATGGRQLKVPADLMADEGGTVYTDFRPWMILSHLAGLPLVAVKADAGGSPGNVASGARLDPGLLLLVGGCPTMLRLPPRSASLGLPTHALPGGVSIVCHIAGITEAITYSIYKFLASAGPAADAWIDAVVQDKSKALLMRVLIALRVLEHDARSEYARWAEATLRDSILPELDASRLLH